MVEIEVFSGKRRPRLPPKLCGCGCGEKFVTRNPDQAYRNAAHAKRGLRKGILISPEKRKKTKMS